MADDAVATSGVRVEVLLPRYAKDAEEMIQREADPVKRRAMQERLAERRMLARERQRRRRAKIREGRELYETTTTGEGTGGLADLSELCQATEHVVTVRRRPADATEQGNALPQYGRKPLLKRQLPQTIHCEDESDQERQQPPESDADKRLAHARELSKLRSKRYRDRKRREQLARIHGEQGRTHNKSADDTRVAFGVAATPPPRKQPRLAPCSK